jgi:hypothetical protein
MLCSVVGAHLHLSLGPWRLDVPTAQYYQWAEWYDGLFQVKRGTIYHIKLRIAGRCC